jgi:hypothetical protein
MVKKFPLHPKHPERICWGCDRYCPADALGCGNGSDRTQHPEELLGDDWYLWGDWGIVASGDGESQVTPDAPDAPNAGSAGEEPGKTGA